MAKEGRSEGEVLSEKEGRRKTPEKKRCSAESWGGAIAMKRGTISAENRRGN